MAKYWKLFKQKWSDYGLLPNLQGKPNDVQVALFRMCLGDEGLAIYNGFTFETAEDQRTVKEIIEKFDSYAMEEVNETYERYIFNSRYQRENESFQSFLSDISNLVKSCNYCNNCVESIVRDRVVLGI